MHNDDIKTQEEFRALRTARIPNKYCRKDLGLSSLGQPGQAMSAWFQSQRTHDLAAGAGRTFVGDDPQGVAAVTARNLVLTGTKCLFTNLAYLFAPEYRDTRQPLMHSIPDEVVLFIGGFYDPDRPEAWSHAELFRMEWAIRDRMDKGIPTFFRTPVPLNGTRLWWSKSFIEHITQLSPEILV